MGRNFLGLVLIVAAAGVSAFWAYPLWLGVGELGATKEELTRTVNQVKDLARLRDDLLARYNSIPRQDLESLEEFFPRSPEAGLLLVNLESLARGSGLLLKTIAVSEGGELQVQPADQPQEKVSSLPFQISVSGSYAAFRSFLAALESSRRLIELDQISFDSGKAGTKESYEFTIQAHTYWRK